MFAIRRKSFFGNTFVEVVRCLCVILRVVCSYIRTTCSVILTARLSELHLQSLISGKAAHLLHPPISLGFKNPCEPLYPIISPHFSHTLPPPACFSSQPTIIPCKRLPGGQSSTTLIQQRADERVHICGRFALQITPTRCFKVFPLSLLAAVKEVWKAVFICRHSLRCLSEFKIKKKVYKNLFVV